MDVVLYAFHGWKSPCEPGVTWYGKHPRGVDPSVGNYFGNFPERIPDYGDVDEDSQPVMDRHLRRMRDVGATVVGVNWYGGKFLDYGAARTFASTVAPKLKAYLQWDNDPCNLDWALTAMRSAGTWSRQPRYWRRQGRPVLAIFQGCNLDAIAGGDRAGLVAQLRAAFASTAGLEPFLVVMDAGWIAVPGVDALAYYGNRNVVVNGGTLVRPATSFAEIALGCSQMWPYQQALAAAAGKEYFYTSMGGWSPLPWLKRAPLPEDFCAPAPGQLEAHVRAARAATPAGGVLTLCSWNEDAEGSGISPSAYTAGRYAEVQAALR